MRPFKIHHLALLLPAIALAPCCLSQARAEEAPTNEKTTQFSSPEGEVTLHSGQAEDIIPKDAPLTLAELDANGDGVITLDEARPSVAMTAEFEYADLNRDGRITQAEFDRWH
jgi:hypothetical protein